MTTPKSRVDWAYIRKVMPLEKTPEGAEARKKVFLDFDPNGNGFLSLAEVDKGVRDVLRLYDLFDAKPVIMRAFQAAKNANKNAKGSMHSDYVERSEFRLLLVYLRQYLELWDMFSTIDTSDDRRVSIDEFKQALPLIEKWGAKIENPEAEFSKMDNNGGGIILFDEFADWALRKNLDLEDDDNFDDEAINNLRNDARRSPKGPKIAVKKQDHAKTVHHHPIPIAKAQSPEPQNGSDRPPITRTTVSLSREVIMGGAAPQAEVQKYSKMTARERVLLGMANMKKYYQSKSNGHNPCAAGFRSKTDRDPYDLVQGRVSQVTEQIRRRDEYLRQKEKAQAEKVLLNSNTAYLSSFSGTKEKKGSSWAKDATPRGTYTLHNWSTFPEAVPKAYVDPTPGPGAYSSPLLFLGL